MTIQYCSDLHLEFRENENFLRKNPLKAAGDILLLAGDIVPFATQKMHDWFFDLISDQFEMVYWVPGNHEYYGYDLAKKCGTFNEEIRENVFLINNGVGTYQGVRLIFSTLWTEIGSANEEEIRLGMSDFHTIKYENGRFRPTHYNQFHQESREFLSGALKQTHAGKTMVITHHVPTFLNYPEKYRGDALTHSRIPAIVFRFAFILKFDTTSGILKLYFSSTSSPILLRMISWCALPVFDSK